MDDFEDFDDFGSVDGLSAEDEKEIQSTSYTKNLLRSAGYIGVEGIKGVDDDLADFISDTKDTIVGSFYDAKDAIRDIRDKVNDWLGSNDALEKIKQLRDNIVEDVKSGKLYNKERSDKVFEEMMGLDGGGGGSFGWGDDEDEEDSSSKDSDSPSANANKIAASQQVAGLNAASMIVSGNTSNTKAAVSANTMLANVLNQTLVGINSSILSLHNDLTNPLNAHLSNFAKYAQTTTAELSKQTQILLSISKTMTAKFGHREDKKEKKNAFEEVLGRSADSMPSLSNWITHTKEKLKSESSTLGMIQAFLDPEMLKTAVASVIASPLSFFGSKALSGFLSNSIVGKKLKDTKAVIKNAFSNAAIQIHKANQKGKSGIIGTILEALDIMPEYGGRVRFNAYEQGAANWTGRDSKALQSVIPTQLATIISILSGKEARLFDYQSGRWMSQRALLGNYHENMIHSIKSAQSGEDTAILTKEAIKVNNEEYKNDKSKQFAEYGEDATKIAEAWRAVQLKLARDPRFDVTEELTKSSVMRYLSELYKGGDSALFDKKHIDAVARLIVQGNRVARPALTRNILKQRARIEQESENFNKSSHTVLNVLNGSYLTPEYDKNTGELQLNPITSNVITQATDDHNHNIFYYLSNMLTIMRKEAGLDGNAPHTNGSQISTINSPGITPPIASAISHPVKPAQLTNPIAPVVEKNTRKEEVTPYGVALAYSTIYNAIGQDRFDKDVIGKITGDPNHLKTEMDLLDKACMQVGVKHEVKGRDEYDSYTLEEYYEALKKFVQSKNVELGMQYARRIMRAHRSPYGTMIDNYNTANDLDALIQFNTGELAEDKEKRKTQSQINKEKRQREEDIKKGKITNDNLSDAFSGKNSLLKTDEKQGIVGDLFDAFNRNLEKIIYGDVADPIKKKYQGAEGLSGILQRTFDILKEWKDAAIDWIKRKWTKFQNSKWGTDFFGTLKDGIVDATKGTWNYVKKTTAKGISWFTGSVPKWSPEYDDPEIFQKKQERIKEILKEFQRDKDEKTINKLTERDKNKLEEERKQLADWIETYRGKRKTEAEQEAEKQKKKKKKEATPAKAARGAEVKKSGMISVSEGEIVLPADMNPNYHGDMTDEERDEVEEKNYQKWKKFGAIGGDFWGKFAKGGEVANKGGKALFSSAGSLCQIPDSNSIKSAGDLDKVIDGVHADFSYILGSEGFNEADINLVRTNITKFADLIKSISYKNIYKNLSDKSKEKIDDLRKIYKNTEENPIAEAIKHQKILKYRFDQQQKLQKTDRNKKKIEEKKKRKAGIYTDADGAIKAIAQTQEKEKSRADEFLNGLFGKIGKKDEDGNSVVWGEIKNIVSKKYHSLAAGGVLGGIAGLAVVGGPLGILGGLAIGSTLKMVNQSHTLTETLFGKQDKTTKEYSGGVLSPKIAKFIKDKLPNYAKAMGAGGVVGAFTGPLGILGGVMMGGGFEYVRSTFRFGEMLFGKDAMTGKSKMDLIKENLFKTIKKNKKGLIIGGLTGLLGGPYGVIGGALLGGATEMLASFSGVTEFFFGRKGIDGRRHGGIFSGIKSSLIQMFTPTKVKGPKRVTPSFWDTFLVHTDQAFWMPLLKFTKTLLTENLRGAIKAIPKGLWWLAKKTTKGIFYTIPKYMGKGVGILGEAIGRAISQSKIARTLYGWMANTTSWVTNSIKSILTPIASKTIVPMINAYRMTKAWAGEKIEKAHRRLQVYNIKKGDSLLGAEDRKKVLDRAIKEAEENGTPDAEIEQLKILRNYAEWSKGDVTSSDIQGYKDYLNPTKRIKETQGYLSSDIDEYLKTVSHSMTENIKNGFGDVSSIKKILDEEKEKMRVDPNYDFKALKSRLNSEIKSSKDITDKNKEKLLKYTSDAVDRLKKYSENYQNWSADSDAFIKKLTNVDDFSKLSPEEQEKVQKALKLVKNQVNTDTSMFATRTQSKENTAKLLEQMRKDNPLQAEANTKLTEIVQEVSAVRQFLDSFTAPLVRWRDQNYDPKEAFNKLVGNYQSARGLAKHGLLESTMGLLQHNGMTFTENSKQMQNFRALQKLDAKNKDKHKKGAVSGDLNLEAFDHKSKEDFEFDQSKVELTEEEMQGYLEDYFGKDEQKRKEAEYILETRHGYGDRSMLEQKDLEFKVKTLKNKYKSKPKKIKLIKKLIKDAGNSSDETTAGIALARLEKYYGIRPDNIWPNWPADVPPEILYQYNERKKEIKLKLSKEDREEKKTLIEGVLDTSKSIEDRKKSLSKLESKFKVNINNVYHGQEKNIPEALRPKTSGGDSGLDGNTGKENYKVQQDSDTQEVQIVVNNVIPTPKTSTPAIPNATPSSIDTSATNQIQTQFVDGIPIEYENDKGHLHPNMADPGTKRAIEAIENKNNFFKTMTDGSFLGGLKTLFGYGSKEDVEKQEKEGGFFGKLFNGLGSFVGGLKEGLIGMLPTLVGVGSTAAIGYLAYKNGQETAGSDYDPKMRKGYDPKKVKEEADSFLGKLGAPKRGIDALENRIRGRKMSTYKPDDYVEASLSTRALVKTGQHALFSIGRGGYALGANKMLSNTIGRIPIVGKVLTAVPRGINALVSGNLKQNLVAKHSALIEKAAKGEKALTATEKWLKSILDKIFKKTAEVTGKEVSEKVVQETSKTIVKKTCSSSLGSKILKGIIKANPYVQGIWIANAFIQGVFDTTKSKMILGVLEPPTMLQRAAAGFINALNEAIPGIGGIIPTKFFVNLLVKIGICSRDLAESRKRAELTVKRYNKEHGTTYSIEEYIENVLDEKTFWDKWNPKNWFGNKKKKEEPKEEPKEEQEIESGSGSHVSQKNNYNRFGNSNIDQSGCGPAVASTVLKTYGRNVNLNQAAKFAQNNKYITESTGSGAKLSGAGTGTEASYFSDIFNANGIQSNYTSDLGQIQSSIQSGRPTVLLGQDKSNKSKANSPFGPNPHYVVAQGQDRNGNLIIDDPELNNTTTYSKDILKNTTLGIATGGGPFKEDGFDYLVEEKTEKIEKQEEKKKEKQDRLKTTADDIKKIGHLPLPKYPAFINAQSNPEQKSLYNDIYGTQVTLKKLTENTKDTLPKNSWGRLAWTLTPEQFFMESISPKSRNNSYQCMDSSLYEGENDEHKKTPVSERFKKLYPGTDPSKPEDLAAFRKNWNIPDDPTTVITTSNTNQSSANNTSDTGVDGENEKEEKSTYDKITNFFGNIYGKIKNIVKSNPLFDFIFGDVDPDKEKNESNQESNSMGDVAYDTGNSPFKVISNHADYLSLGQEIRNKFFIPGKGENDAYNSNGEYNCVTYAWGRYNQIYREVSKRPKARWISWDGNGGAIYDNTPPSMEKYKATGSQKTEPHPGALIVWRLNVDGAEQTGDGHIAVIERVYRKNGKLAISISEGAFGKHVGEVWEIIEYIGKDGRSKERWQYSTNYRFSGIVYNPAVEEWLKKNKHKLTVGRTNGIPSKSEVITKTIAYLRKAGLGLSDAAIAGILGNMAIESGGFNTYAINRIPSDQFNDVGQRCMIASTEKEYKRYGSSGAIGLCQWLGPRRTALLDKVKKQNLYVTYEGKSYPDFGQLGPQLELLVEELRGDESASLHAMQHKYYTQGQFDASPKLDVDQYTYEWMDKFERPSQSEMDYSIDDRRTSARNIYKYYMSNGANDEKREREKEVKEIMNKIRSSNGSGSKLPKFDVAKNYHPNKEIDKILRSGGASGLVDSLYDSYTYKTSSTPGNKRYTSYPTSGSGSKVKTSKPSSNSVYNPQRKKTAQYNSINFTKLKKDQEEQVQSSILEAENASAYSQASSNNPIPRSNKSQTIIHKSGSGTNVTNCSVNVQELIPYLEEIAKNTRNNMLIPKIVEVLQTSVKTMGKMNQINNNVYGANKYNQMQTDIEAMVQKLNSISQAF